MTIPILLVILLISNVLLWIVVVDNDRARVDDNVRICRRIDEKGWPR
jgi:hypothetical protein